MTAPDTLPPELDELGELLREDPPRPDSAWARELDARAAAGFPRPPRAVAAVAAAARGARSAAAPSPRSARRVACSSSASRPPRTTRRAATRRSAPAAARAARRAAAAQRSRRRRPAERAASTPRGRRPARPRRPRRPRPGARGARPSSDARTRRAAERTAALDARRPAPRDRGVADGVVRVDRRGRRLRRLLDGRHGATGGDVRAAHPDRAAEDGARRPLASSPMCASARSLAGHHRRARVGARPPRRTRAPSAQALLRALAARDHAQRDREHQGAPADRLARRSRRRKRRAARASPTARATRTCPSTLVAERGGAARADDGGRWTPGDALRRRRLRVLEVAAGMR